METVYRSLFRREVGRPDDFERLRKKWCTDLFSRDLVLEPTGQPDCARIPGAIQSVRIDNTEERFALLGCGDGSLVFFDMEKNTSEPQPQQPQQEQRRDFVQNQNQNQNQFSSIPILAVASRSANTHTKGVSVADWYHCDSGLFTASSYDGSVGVWDTNALQCVHLYRVSDCVNTMANGQWSSTAALVAVATRSDHLRMLDLRQESNAHTLVGHREQVTSLQWSPLSPHILLSGDVEGSIYVWDLRKPVPLAELGSRNRPEVIGPMARSDSKLTTPGTQWKRQKTVSKLDKKLEQIISNSVGVVRKRPDHTSAYRDGGVNAICFSGKGHTICTYCVAPSEDNLKLWDAISFAPIGQTSCNKRLGLARNHPLIRMDICSPNNVLDSEERVIVCAEGRMMSVVASSNFSYSWWPSGHTRIACSVQYNRRRENVYSVGQDGMFRVWSYPQHQQEQQQQQQQQEEEDNWD